MPTHRTSEYLLCGSASNSNSRQARRALPSYVAPSPIRLTSSQLRTLTAWSFENSPKVTEWFSSRAAFGEEADIELIVQGNRDHSVRIINILPVEHCGSPLTGTLFFAENAGLEGGTILHMNLNNPNGPLGYNVTSSDGISHSGSDYFGSYSISLSHGEQYTFHVDVSLTQPQYCKFSLELTVLDAGKKITEPVTNHGQLFQVSKILYGKWDPGYFASYKDLYLGGVLASPTQAWVPVDPKTWNSNNPHGGRKL
jgi:hypothetical protein